MTLLPLWCLFSLSVCNNLEVVSSVLQLVGCFKCFTDIFKVLDTFFNIFIFHLGLKLFGLKKSYVAMRNSGVVIGRGTEYMTLQVIVWDTLGHMMSIKVHLIRDLATA